MLRIAALNDEESRDSEENIIRPKEPSQEVQEENALKSYTEALQDHKNGNIDRAAVVYQQLLDSNLLEKVKADRDVYRTRKADNICSLYAKPSLMLKYSCLKNLALISYERNDFEKALDFYTQALDIEGSDVCVWHKAGLIAMKLSFINTALDFFCKGLECSPKHWLCLDNIIICLFVLGDYVNCLYYIARAFNLDSYYTRGHILRDQIFFEQPTLVEDIKVYFPKINLHMDKLVMEKEDIKKKVKRDILSIRSEYHVKSQAQANSELNKEKEFCPSVSLESQTWSSLGEYILQIYTEISDVRRSIDFLSPLNLSLAFSKKDSHKGGGGGGQEKDKENKSTEKQDVDKDRKRDQNISKEQSDEGERKNKKGRGSALMEELLWGGKRRSARVRSSLRGNPEPMDVAEALRRILPRKLLHKTKQNKSDQPVDSKILEENSLDTMDLYRLFERQESAEERRQKEEQERSEVEHDIDQVVESEGYFGTKEEESDICSFIERNHNKTVIDVTKSYVLGLENHWKKTWPNALPNLYIRCYQIMRKHYQTSFKICSEEFEFKEVAREAGTVLLYGELCLEHNSSNRNLPQISQKLETNFEMCFMQNIMELIDRNYLFESDEKYFEFLVRMYWLRCHMFLAKAQTNLAIDALHELLSTYDMYPNCATIVISLKNNRKNNVISKPIVEEFLVFQSRKRSLAEVVRLYEDGSYQELTEILKETFTAAPDNIGNQFKEQENELVSRQTQLSMLINGLYYLNEYAECLYWLETCCYELLQAAPSSFYSVPQEPEEESWMVVFDRFLIAMEDCLTLGNVTIDEALPHHRVSRFVQTLCHAICKELEDSDRPPCPARPWLMLNRILIGLEKNEKQDVSSNADDEDDENDIPSSVLILFTAHEYLGRREWCNCNESVLLFLIMDQVIPNIRNPDWSSFRETIQQHLEQVVYCLYSHPSKKAKARYLTEHNVTCIPLTWKRGIQLFDLFRPDETPSYDSLRINLIGSETEVLFRRIAALIPDENDPMQNSEKMLDFIIGKRNDVPEAIVKLPETVKDLFYILGDYYFKTHESAKAVNYLLIDLCANPDRVDSWASMALSRASILEQQLNSCDPVKDEVFLQDALSALRCYEHCLQLDSNQCALWIEYGTFVYTIHSFCSQRMKLESLNMGLEKFEELETTKNKMLDTAKQAFVNANLIWYEVKEESERQDERWLHHYMLGKICEKHGDLSYLDHYEKAAALLYENEAEYPSKIGYTAPQTLAIEALEVYYRLHVCVIKNLELNEGKPLDTKTRQIFNKYLELGGKGHFVKQMSKSELAKMKVKEAEVSAQNAKRFKIVQDLLDEMVRKVAEDEEKEREKHREAGFREMSVLVEKPHTMEAKSPPDLMVQLVEGHKTNARKLRRPSSDDSSPECKRLKDETGAPLPTKMVLDFREKNEEEKPSDNGKQESSASRQMKQVKAHSYSHRQCPESDNYYYITLDELRNQPQSGSILQKKKRRPSHVSVSSSSCGSEEVKYDDDSSSSTSSSETSDSSPSSTTSTSTNRENCKGLEEKDKAKVNESGREESPTYETGDNEEKSSPVPDESEDDMLSRCLVALETCAIRFPQHYKSVYRLAHFYFRSKKYRDLGKCKELLLGRYQTPNGTITGLFADRKNTNFFNGIWRIPAGDVDRPGSFASHMSRSVLLLMEVLRDLNDHKMLLELCLQLRKVPEPDKKYLREDERNQLSVQAINLSIKTLRKNVRESSVMTLPIVLDSYRCYQKVQKHYPNRESVFGDLLLDSFKRLGKGDKCTLEQAIKFCQSEISSTKTKAPRNLHVNPASTPKQIPTKSKKEEKKKTTPKPQITAKAIVKPLKAKKPMECKKKPIINMMFNNNQLADPASSSGVMNDSIAVNASETTKRGAQRTHSYSEILKASCQKSEKKPSVTDQNPITSMFEQINIDYSQQLIMEQMKLMSNPTLYRFQNYPVDYGGDYFKQYSSIYNSALMGNYLSQLQEYKKPKAKKPNPRTVLKSELEMPPAQEEKKAKTNFNIDDILGKPSTSSVKPQSPNILTPSQINMSIEDKIKNAFNDLDNPQEQMEAINLSQNRRKFPEQAGKHSAAAEHEDGSSAKRICRNFPAKNDEIEVVIIDD